MTFRRARRFRIERLRNESTVADDIEIRCTGMREDFRRTRSQVLSDHMYYYVRGIGAPGECEYVRTDGRWNAAQSGSIPVCPIRPGPRPCHFVDSRIKFNVQRIAQ